MSQRSLFPNPNSALRTQASETSALATPQSKIQNLKSEIGGPYRSVLAFAYGLLSLALLSFPLFSVAEAASAVIKKGSFIKSTAVASQTVAHGLGETPKAVILWTSGGSTDGAFRGGFRFGFGVSDGVTSKSASAASNDALGTSNASRRQANKVLTIVAPGEVVLAEADLVSWDATNFTLNWTTNDPSASIIHFVAIGGTDVSSKVLGWTTPTAVGNQSLSGIGFQPDVVLHAHSGGISTALPVSGPHAGFGIGVMNSVGEQWANQAVAFDAQGTSATERVQQTTASIYSMDGSLGTFYRASYVSMDAGGFTVNFTTVQAAAYPVFSLALKGLKSKIGSFPKSTAAQPAAQSVTGTGFQPSAVLLSSFQTTTQANPVTHARFGLGASDGTSEGASAFQDTNNLGTTSVDAIDKTGKAFVKVNNNTPAIEAEADLAGFDSNGFTLNWTANDAVATEILYLALAPLTSVPNGTLQFSSATYSVNENGGNAVITVTRNGGSAGAVGVTFSTSNGTANAGSDYTSTTQTVSFADGDTANKTVSVPILDDAVFEGNETVNLALSSPTGGATLGSPSTAVLTITDNDLPTVTISATDATATEAGPTTGTFTVSRTGSTAAALTVNYTVSGTATSGSDYVALTASVTIPSGSATATITVTPMDDSLVESDETVIVTLAANAAYTVGTPSNATVTITSDDGVPTVTISPSDATATEAGTTTGTFTVSRTGSTAAALTVNYTVSGTATSGSDYTALTGSVTIPSGSATATITVTPVDDSLVESDETVIVTLTANAAYTVGAPSSATVTITDNDSIPSTTPTYIYDDLGRLRAVVDPGGDTAVYSYDAVGNLLSISRQGSSLLSIIEFTPKSGPVGTTVNLFGTGFSTTPANNTVKFNGVTAAVTSATQTEIVATVPSGATTGPISVTVGASTATSALAFTVIGATGAPTITSFTPTIGTPGTAVTITGTNFETTPINNNLVFNITRSGVNSSTATTIATSVPPGTSGRISVATPSGKSTSNADFFIPPPPFTAADVEFTGRMTIGGSQPVTISAANKIGLVVFDGTAGQQVSLGMSGVTYGWSWVTIFKPNGTTLMSSVRVSPSGGDVVLPMLPDNGTYTILIDPDNPNTGNATLTLSEDATYSIAIGGPPVTVSIARVGQRAKVTFTGSANQQVSLGMSGVTFGWSWVTIFKPDGTTLMASIRVSPSGGDATLVVLPVSGTYTILVDPDNPNTGSATLTLTSP